MRLRIALLASLVPLCGCSIAAEQLRSTYDERVLIRDSPRAVVEAQLGRPVTSTPLPDGGVEAVYRTASISADEKRSLTSGHAEADGLTLGLAELFHPAFIGEDETKVFKIDYSQDGVVSRIAWRCSNAKTASWQQPQNGSGKHFVTSGLHPCAGGFVTL